MADPNRNLNPELRWVNPSERPGGAPLIQGGADGEPPQWEHGAFVFRGGNDASRFKGQRTLCFRVVPSSAHLEIS